MHHTRLCRQALDVDGAESGEGVDGQVKLGEPKGVLEELVEGVIHQVSRRGPQAHICGQQEHNRR
jgi:hypothetical protein